MKGEGGYPARLTGRRDNDGGERMKDMQRLTVAGLTLASTMFLTAPALAQSTYPTKPVRIIAPFPPGGTTDLLCRLFAQKLGEAFGRQFIVDNRPGAAGSIGHEAGARSAGDGYTLVLTTKGGLVINPLLYKKLPFDPINDFSYITVVISAGPVLTVHPSLPARSVKELVALGKARPGQ
ncbi:MAG: tripartite tricarboxylate transporter substrate binding protein, partial [Phycisphaerales bacterium]|nr:tripartite tricarboxylate transporter substrate binding protein [Phycisphaerales bacterium]